MATYWLNASSFPFGVITPAIIAPGGGALILESALQTPRLYLTQTSIAFAGQASGPAVNLIYGATLVSGTILAHPTANKSAVNHIIINDIATAGGSDNTLFGFLVQHAIGAHEGLRAAVGAYMQVTGLASGSAYVADVAGLFLGYSQRSQGGTGTDGHPNNYRGSLFGFNANVWLAGAVEFYREIHGLEIDVAIHAGGSAYARTGILLVQSADAAEEADGDDAGIIFADQTGATAKWKKGIQFGATWAPWSFGATSTLIGIQPQVYETPGTCPVLNGVDFRSASFQPGGFAFASNGFSVDPDGEIQFGTFAADVSASVGGTIAITDAAGNARNLMVAA